MMRRGLDSERSLNDLISSGRSYIGEHKFLRASTSEMNLLPKSDSTSYHLVAAPSSYKYYVKEQTKRLFVNKGAVELWQHEICAFAVKDLSAFQILKCWERIALAVAGFAALLQTS